MSLSKAERIRLAMQRFAELDDEEEFGVDSQVSTEQACSKSRNSLLDATEAPQRAESKEGEENV